MPGPVPKRSDQRRLRNQERRPRVGDARGEGWGGRPTRLEVALVALHVQTATVLAKERRGPIAVPRQWAGGTVLVSMQNGDQYAPAH